MHSNPCPTNSFLNSTLWAPHNPLSRCTFKKQKLVTSQSHSTHLSLPDILATIISLFTSVAECYINVHLFLFLHNAILSHALISWPKSILTDDYPLSRSVMVSKSLLLWWRATAHKGLTPSTMCRGQTCADTSQVFVIQRELKKDYLCMLFDVHDNSTMCTHLVKYPLLALPPLPDVECWPLLQCMKLDLNLYLSVQTKLSAWTCWSTPLYVLLPPPLGSY